MIDGIPTGGPCSFTTKTLLVYSPWKCEAFSGNVKGWHKTSRGFHGIFAAFPPSGHPPKTHHLLGWVILLGLEASAPRRYHCHREFLGYSFPNGPKHQIENCFFLNGNLWDFMGFYGGLMGSNGIYTYVWMIYMGNIGKYFIQSTLWEFATVLLLNMAIEIL